MQFLFNFTLALRSIRGNLLRSVLTVLIIGIGIMALVCILTAFDILKNRVTEGFSSLGSNSFQITNEQIRQKKKKKGGVHIYSTESKIIKYDDARTFKERFQFPAKVGLSMNATPVATVRYRSEKTNPNINVMGVDENYLDITDTKLEMGRNMSPYELQSGSYVCILGHGIASKLFKTKRQDAVNQVVSVGNTKYRVIGVAAEKGGSMIMDADNMVLIPISNARNVYGGDNNYVISVTVPDVKLRTLASEEAEGLMRVIRKVRLGAENDFSINQNDSLANMLLDSLKYVLGAAVVIGLITLLGSIIGLMNIMLVSVAERTREIGVSKAMGAKASVIQQQFLTESIIISLMGGVLGVVLGILLGNLVGLALDSSFIVPWRWMGLGVGLCAITGIVSGIYPAIKASKLDPIQALRYE